MALKRARVAVVTGGNRGIGLEVCRELARRGLRVVLASRDGHRSDSAAAELAATGLDVRPRMVDITDPASVRELSAWLERELGGADVGSFTTGGPFPGRSVARFSLGGLPSLA